MELYHPPPPPHPRGEASKNMYFYRNPWTPFTPDSQLLHQAPFTIFAPDNFYNKQFLHQAPFTPESFFTDTGHLFVVNKHINFWSRFAQFGLEGGMCSWLVLFDAIFFDPWDYSSLFIHFCWSLSLLDPHPHPTPKSNKVRWNVKNSTNVTAFCGQ